ncbi:alpha/beta hydrolase family protein [Amycolatopsis pithecellobii]|nr:hypothetical protein [Amycolatopsis pithecellobii]
MSTPTISAGVEAIDPAVSATLDQIARGLAYGTRSPLLHTPSEEGMAFTDFSFPSTDGTPLEAWLIPAGGSDRLIICTHAFGFSRAGFPSNIEPWKSRFGAGNDYDINFIPDYKVLHDAGYNVLAFDFRNFGLSAAANGGLQSAFRFEGRDVRGALDYVRRTPELAGMRIGIFARCMGANATFRAIHDDPAGFSDVRALVAPPALVPSGDPRTSAGRRRVGPVRGGDRQEAAAIDQRRALRGLPDPLGSVRHPADADLWRA